QNLPILLKSRTGFLSRFPFPRTKISRPETAAQLATPAASCEYSVTGIERLCAPRRIVYRSDGEFSWLANPLSKLVRLRSLIRNRMEPAFRWLDLQTSRLNRGRSSRCWA